MNLATVSAIIIATLGALLLGMAALIKTMVLSQLDDIQSTLEDVRSDIHAIDLRVTRLEAQARFYAKTGTAE